MKDCLVLVALLGAFGWLYRGTVAPTPYIYDESDYMYAASQGWAANYAERPTLPFPEFLGEGLSSHQRSVLAETIRDNNDIVFYRHWHGPVLTYWLMTIGNWHLSEFGTRSSMVLFHLLTFALIYAGCRTILPGTEGFLAALLGSGMYLFSFSNIRSASQAVPHMIFVFFYMAALFCFVKLSSGGGFRWRYPLAISAALAFCSLEVTLALLAALPLCCLAYRRELFAGWTASQWLRFAAGPAAAFVATVLVVWPGAWLKLSFLKAYLFMGYLAVARKSAWGSSLSVADTWRLRFTSSPVEWILFAAALILFFAFRKRTMQPALPFLIYTICMIVLVARVNTDEPRYLSPFLPALQVFAGITLAVQLSRFRAAPRAIATGLLLASLLWNSHRQFVANPINQAPAESAILAGLRQQDLRGKSILVPSSFVPVIHYYFPGIRVRGYAEEGGLSDAIRDGAFDGVMYTDPVFRFERLRRPAN